MTVVDHLQTMFQADAEAQAAQERFFSAAPAAARLAARRAAIADADDDPAVARTQLMRVADLSAQVPGPEMADALIDLLDRTDPSIQDAAGRALIEAGYDRYAEVARAIDRALEANRSGPAMETLPFVVAEIAEPSALSILRRFLSHPDADVVASAIEACAELGDPDAVPYIEPLLDDDRRVSLDDHDEETTATVGELATQTIEELGFDPEDEDE